MSGAGHFRLKTALFALAFAMASAGEAFAGCEHSSSRDIELSAGQHVGGGEHGFAPLALGPKEVVLTFDDGPNPDTTPLILDTLRANCIAATFFVIGPAANSYPGLLRRELSEGHSIGGHTWNHEPLVEKPVVTAIADITRGFRPLSAVNAPANLFRFPGMASSPALLDWLKRHGMAAVAADIDAGTGSAARPDLTLEAIKAQLRKKGRGIILLKDSQANTVALLPSLIEFLQREGYTVRHLKGHDGRVVLSSQP